MSRYRRKATVIEARQWVSGPDDPKLGITKGRRGFRLRNSRLGTSAPIEPGDWIIQGEDGTLHVCPDRAFRNIYEPATGRQGG